MRGEKERGEAEGRRRGEKERGGYIRFEAHAHLENNFLY